MAEHSSIEWTDATWNPITGCSLVSEGCRHCYAATLAATRLKNHPSRKDLARLNAAGEAKFTGEVRFNEQWLDQPLRWKRPRMIFVCAHADLFHENVPDEWIDKVFAVMALAPHHTFQVLTKRPERMRAYLSGHLDRLGEQIRYMAPKPSMSVAEAMRQFGQEPSTPWWPLPNVWLGISVEDQARADERIPHLLATPAAVRFVSAEPLLGPVSLEPWLPWPDGGCELPNGDHFGCAGCEMESGPACRCPRKRSTYRVEEGPRGIDGCPEYVHTERVILDWVIVGGESGPRARPMHPDWARSLRDQCAAAEVPFLFKQWGAWEASLDRDRDDPDGRKDYKNDYVDHGNSRWLNLAGGQGFHGARFHVMRQVGKKAAGRLLDGVEHNGFPEVRHG